MDLDARSGSDALQWPQCSLGCFGTGKLYGQSLKEQIVGTWKLVSIYNEENGVKKYNFGDKPVGLLMFDRSGNVIQHLSKPGVAKFATGNRLKGTDAEYRAPCRA